MMRVRVFAAALALTLAGSLPVHAQDFQKPFKTGLDAREKNPAETERQMREAIRINPMESTDKVGGVGGLVRFGGTEYLPYFFLGESLFKRNDCAGALDAWYRSEQQGAVKKVQQYYKTMQDGLTACERKGLLLSPKFEEAIAAATKDITTATTNNDTARSHALAAGEIYTPSLQGQIDAAVGLIKEAHTHLEAGRKTRAASEFVQVTTVTRQANAILQKFETELADALNRKADFAAQLTLLDREIDTAYAIERSIENKKTFLTDGLTASRQSGRDALARARKSYETARTSKSVSAIADGSVAASAALKQFQQVLNDATELERKDKIARADKELRGVRRQFGSIEKSFKDFDAAVRPTTDPRLTAERQGLEKQYRTALPAFNAANKSGDAAAIEAAGKTAQQIRTLLDKLLQELGVKQVVPEALGTGAGLFLRGDYDGALGALAPEGAFAPEEPLLPHVYMFRAAAHYMLYLKSKSSDASQLAEAHAAVALLASVNPSFEPDTRAFSPKFIDFFRTTRREVLASTPPATAPAQP